MDSGEQTTDPLIFNGMTRKQCLMYENVGIENVLLCIDASRKEKVSLCLTVTDRWHDIVWSTKFLRIHCFCIYAKFETVACFKLCLVTAYSQ